MERKFFLASVAVGLSGLACTALTLITGTAGPGVLFRVLTPLGMALIVLGLMLLAVFWLMSFYRAAEAKNLPLATLWAGAGLVLFLLELHRYF